MTNTENTKHFYYFFVPQKKYTWDIFIMISDSSFISKKQFQALSISVSEMGIFLRLQIPVLF